MSGAVSGDRDSSREPSNQLGRMTTSEGACRKSDKARRRRGSSAATERGGQHMACSAWGGEPMSRTLLGRSHGPQARSLALTGWLPVHDQLEPQRTLHRVERQRQTAELKADCIVIYAQCPGVEVSQLASVLLARVDPNLPSLQLLGTPHITAQDHPIPTQK